MTTVVTVAHPSDHPNDEVIVHEHSVGGARAGIKFNPDSHPGVRKLKALAGAFMEACHQEMQNRDADDGDGKRCLATAMTHAESAQMFAVKGLFARRNAGKE